MRAEQVHYEIIRHTVSRCRCVFCQSRRSRSSDSEETSTLSSAPSSIQLNNYRRLSRGPTEPEMVQLFSINLGSRISQSKGSNLVPCGHCACFIHMKVCNPHFCKQSACSRFFSWSEKVRINLFSLSYSNEIEYKYLLQCYPRTSGWSLVGRLVTDSTSPFVLSNYDHPNGVGFTPLHYLPS